MAKDFTRNIKEQIAVNSFITPTDNTPSVEVEVKASAPIQKPEISKKEKKERLNLLITPTLKEEAKKVAYMQGECVNSLIIEALTSYINEHRNLIEKYDTVIGK